MVNNGVCVTHGAMVKQCSHENCSKNAQQGGVCVTHGAVVKQCSRPDCSNIVVQGRVCITHGARVKAKQNCSLKGCSRQSRVGGVCYHHHKKQIVLTINSITHCKPNSISHNSQSNCYPNSKPDSITHCKLNSISHNNQSNCYPVLLSPHNLYFSLMTKGVLHWIRYVGRECVKRITLMKNYTTNTDYHCRIRCI